MPFDRLTVFWIAMAITLPLFFAGIGFKISFWSTGWIRDLEGRIVERASVWIALRQAMQVILGRGLRQTFVLFVRDGLLHRKLWREDKLRWTAHFFMLAGFMTLFALSIITGFFEEILHFMLKIDTPLVRFVTNKDTPLMAILNETFGLIIFVGLAIAMYRRFVQRPAQLRTTSFDRTTVIVLAIIMLTGYPIEAFRLLMEQVPPELAWYSYIGYPLALILKPLEWNWPIWHYWTFMVHVAACIFLALHMPFSKFFHVLVSPIVATANALTSAVEE